MTRKKVRAFVYDHGSGLMGVIMFGAGRPVAGAIFWAVWRWECIHELDRLRVQRDGSQVSENLSNESRSDG